MLCLLGSDGNSIQLPGAYAPSTKKSYFEMSKNLDKKFYMYISIIYVRSSSFTKNQYFASSPWSCTEPIWYFRKFNSAPGCVCSLYQKIIFRVVEKFWQKILCVHLHKIWAFVKFHEKILFFVVYVKKRKFIL